MQPFTSSAVQQASVTDAKNLVYQIIIQTGNEVHKRTKLRSVLILGAIWMLTDMLCWRCRYGDNYWKVDFSMNCSQTVDGWFELKGYSPYASLGWETNINQDPVCSGTAGGIRPYSSINHVARCGFTNVFEWEQNNCIVDILIWYAVSPSWRVRISVATAMCICKERFLHRPVKGLQQVRLKIC